MSRRVLVTGGSGFIGSHALVQLLKAGHTVRATLRSLEQAEPVRAMVERGGAEPGPAGERFLAISGPVLSVAEMSETLRERLGEAPRRRLGRPGRDGGEPAAAGSPEGVPLAPPHPCGPSHSPMPMKSRLPLRMGSEASFSA